MNKLYEQAADRAVALQYDGQAAPRVTAKGGGDIAAEIIAIAREHGVHLHADPQLAQLLSRLDLNQEIPENLYLVVARVIAFAYALAGKVPEGFHSTSDSP